MGMAPGTKGWRFCDPKSRRVGKSRNIIFAVPKRMQQDSNDDYELIKLSSPPPLEGESGSSGELASGGDSAPEVAQQPPADAPVTAKLPTSPPVKPAPKAVPQTAERRALCNLPHLDYKAAEEGKGKVIKPPVRDPSADSTADDDEVEQLVGDQETT
ncbi:hypothetical protein BD310DRAFT_977557 [Dichomitus squalens]|uniref:Uncharacterized protein n=1 Tax=Dichomitus squalens TaxID=114155 RepID=A0A4Q9PUM6_9APHY|nr:hypothetical protein BD310DRAFT_977557 [Dichomitus squalens]